MELRFDIVGAASHVRTACEDLQRHGEPYVSLYWSVVVPVGFFVGPSADLLVSNWQPGTTRIPLLKLAATLKHALAANVGDRVELDFGGVVPATVTFAASADGSVRLENEDSGLSANVSALEFCHAVEAFHAALAVLLRDGCPALLAAAIDKGWLTVPAE